MSSTTELMSANKASANVFYGLTTKAFEGLEKYIDLNLQTARAAIAESAANTQAALSSKDAQEFLSLQASLLQPVAEKMTAYSRQVYDIATATTAEFQKVSESTASELQAKFLVAIEAAAKNAPAGSGNAVAAVKAAVAAANKAYEGAQKAVKRAAETAEANFQAVNVSATKSAKVKRAA